MKRLIKKIDLPFTLSVIILILAGIWIRYLLHINQSIQNGMEILQEKIKRMELFYQCVSDMYFIGLQTIQLHLDEDDKELLQEGVVVCLPTTPLDSAEKKAVKYTLSRLQHFKGCKVRIWMCGEKENVIADWIKEYDFETIHFSPKPYGVPETVIFYLDVNQKATAFFHIQPYTVHLLEKYCKFIREHYPLNMP